MKDEINKIHNMRIDSQVLSTSPHGHYKGVKMETDEKQTEANLPTSHLVEEHRTIVQLFTDKVVFSLRQENNKILNYGINKAEWSGRVQETLKLDLGRGVVLDIQLTEEKK